MGSVLSDQDVDALLEVIEALGAARSIEQLRRVTVSLIPWLVHSDVTTWNDVDVVGGRIAVVIEPDRVYPVEPQEMMAYVDDHPVITYTRETGDGRPRAISDFLSEDAFHATGIYQYCYRLMDVEDQLSFTLPDPALVVGVAINRNSRGFSARDRRLLNLLRPHVLQAYRNCVAVRRLHDRIDGLEQAADAFGDGVILCGVHGRIDYLTVGARQILARWFDATAATTLPSAITEWMQRDSSSGPLWPLIIPRNGSHLLVRRLPRTGGGGNVILLSEPAMVPLESLLGVGLTRRQAEILRLVAQGLTNSAVAVRLGISVRTVDTHVQQAFDKLGVDNRLAAANLLRQMGR